MKLMPSKIHMAVTRLIREKTHAGALYYAVVIALVIAVVLSLFLLLFHVRVSSIDTELLKDQLRSNLKSGLLLYFNSPKNYGKKETSELQVFDDLPPVFFERKQWGAFDITKAWTGKGNVFVKQTLLVGEEIKNDEQPALYIRDNKEYLNLAGNTQLIGKCYLPKLGYKRVIIEGQRFENEEAIIGEVLTSQASLPAINESLFRFQEKCSRSINIENKGTVRFENRFGSKVCNSFLEPEKIIVLNEDTYLDGVSIQGHVLVLSNHRIVVSRRCSLQDVVMYAPSIVFEEGFSGSLQAFATKEIIIKNYCRFAAPSFFAVFAKSRSSTGITIKSNTSINGDILVFSATQNAVLDIKTDSKIHGRILCNSIIKLKGEVAGSIFANRFLYESKSGIFENCILNGKINSSEISPFYVGSKMFKEQRKSQVYKRLF